MEPNNMDGTVNIHGKEYKTVALRVTEFREGHHIEDGWAVCTAIHHVDDQSVICTAEIKDPDGRIVAADVAEEKRNSSQINATSAVENCATSAIGRALAAAGFGGTEYASANEVSNAIHQQTTKPIVPSRVYVSDNQKIKKAVESRPQQFDEQDAAPWKLVEVHFGKNDGVALGNLSTQSLSWYQTKWKHDVDKDGNPRQPSEQDTILRQALDESLGLSEQIASDDEIPF
jgi:hypothetical protein